MLFACDQCSTLNTEIDMPVPSMISFDLFVMLIKDIYAIFNQDVLMIHLMDDSEIYHTEEHVLEQELSNLNDTDVRASAKNII